MYFIDSVWKKGHILGNNRSFFEYEHIIDGKVTFLIAKDRSSKTIDGIIGYLPASRDNDHLDIWGVVWKVRDNAMNMLGMELKKRLIEITGARAELGVGSNYETSIPLLKMLMHYTTGKMHQYYMLADTKDYNIAKIYDKPTYPQTDMNNLGIVVNELFNIDEVNAVYDLSKNANIIPYKDSWYINRRYFLHPIYKYHVYGLAYSGFTQALVVMRRQECNDSSCLRIVDYIGNQRLFSGTHAFWKLLLQENSAEYIDFYELGFDIKAIQDAGFVERKENDVNIIPNYFYPFERANVDIWVDSSETNCLFFKADGDQDRPN